MKKTLYHIGMLAAAALAFASCNKEVEVRQPLEEVTHVATISLGKADVLTKTEVIEGETTASYKWLDDDNQYLRVYENDTEGTITEFKLNAEKTVATLTVAFTGEPTAPYSYTAKYAKTLSTAKNPLILSEQKPGATSFDPSADILVSKATEDVTGLSERATEFTFTMGRVVTVNKMTLTGLEAGEVISSVEFTLSKTVTGYASVDEENNSYKYSNGSAKLTLKYEGTDGTVPANGQFPVYFVCAPVEAAGIVSVVVTTDKNVYTKSNTLDPNPFDGKTITFAIGTMKRFTMAMAGYGEAVGTAVDYTLVENNDMFVGGAKYLIVNKDGDKAMGAFTSASNSYYGLTNVTKKGKVITISSEQVQVITLEEGATAGQFYMIDSDNNYLYWNSGNSISRAIKKGDTNAYLWNITIEKITNVGTNIRFLQYNKQSTRFACYQASSKMADVDLYVDLKSIVELEGAGLAWSATEGLGDVKDQKLALPTLANPNNLTITYTSSNPAVATVEENAHTVTLLAEGTTEIHAIFAGNETYKNDDVYYTLTVEDSREPVLTPAFTVQEGAVDAGTKVGITCETADATIYYTVDDTDPTEESAVYTDAISIDAKTTIKAIATKSGYKPSAIARATYTLKGSFAKVEFSWTPSATTSGYTFKSENGSSKSGYIQDKNGTTGLDLKITKSDNSALFSTAPSSISLTVKVGGGSAKDPLDNNVVAYLIDEDGNNIASTQTTVTTKVETTTGKDYKVSIPIISEAYGVRISHAKDSGYNIRIYGISFVAE